MKINSEENNMQFKNVIEALRALETTNSENKIHEEAYEYLAKLNDKEELKDLVQSLEDDDTSIRWEAADMLSRKGIKSVRVVLNALMDPQRVSDPRFRQSVIHMIHKFNDPILKKQLEPLIETIKGPAADIATMWKAYHILEAIEKADKDE